MPTESEMGNRKLDKYCKNPIWVSGDTPRNVRGTEKNLVCNAEKKKKKKKKEGSKQVEPLNSF